MNLIRSVPLIFLDKNRIKMKENRFCQKIDENPGIINPLVRTCKTILIHLVIPKRTLLKVLNYRVFFQFFPEEYEFSSIEFSALEKKQINFNVSPV